MDIDSTTIIHWFRKGLRVHDNPALKKATDLIESYPGKYVLRPVFILDPKILLWLRVGANRFRFLQQSLLDLDKNLRNLNSRLYVIRGNPVDVFSRVFKEWNVKLLTFEIDYEPYAINRDKNVVEIAKKLNIDVIEELSHTLYNPGLVLKQNLGKPVVTYQKFLSIVETHIVKNPTEIPNKLSRNSQPKNDSFENKDSKCYDSPSLLELQVVESELGPNLFPGGETEGLIRMEKYLKETKWICAFEKPNTSPNSIEPSTTVLSPYLKFGCLSSRLFYKKLKEILDQNKGHSKPPTSLMGQLMWREFYYAAGFAVPNFDKMRENSICMQIPWENNKAFLESWTHGKTGYPFIDAIMRQLRKEGWIHHLARHAVACFLTRGDLWISWEEGQKVFEELLLDADWALNAGNWMWLSASAFFHQFFRVYSPVSFGKKTDSEGKYIKKYVPELKEFPSDIIYEPWKASLQMQQTYGCIIGKDYPSRIVIHEDVYKLNIQKMSQAYKKNKLAKEEMNTLNTSAVKRKCEATTSGNSKKLKNEPNKSIKKYFSKK